MGSPEHKLKVWNLIKDIKIGMLVTHDGEAIRSRPMQLVQDAYDGTLWFYTNASDPKVREIKDDQQVNVTFADPSNGRFASLCGHAKLSKDKELINRYWNDYVGAWFPQGKDHSDTAMLEIKIEHGEHWDNKTNPISFYYELKKALAKGEVPEIGENQTF